MNTNAKRSALAELALQRFLVVAPDCESYQTAFCKGADLLTTLAGMVYSSADDMPTDEMAKLNEHVDNPDNWFEADDVPTTLDWDIGCESGLVIQVFRLTTTRLEDDAGKKLVALARAAWALADGSEDADEKDETGARYLRVPEDLHKELSDRLGDLDKLPEVPGYIAEGPPKAEYALGLSDLPVGPALAKPTAAAKDGDGKGTS